MIITAENRELVKLFMKILMNIGISDEIIEFITAMLQNEERMDSLVDYIAENPEATEKQILEKALQISGIR